MILRELRIEDAELMLEWMHDDEVVKDLRANFKEKTLDDCINFIVISHDDKSNLHLAVCNEEDEYMGTVSLKNIDGYSAEFGITIRKEAMGKGYSCFAMKEIIEIAFNELGLKKVYWCVSPHNIRACRFYEKSQYKKCNAPIEAMGYSDKEKDKYVWYEVTKEGGDYE